MTRYKIFRERDNEEWVYYYHSLDDVPRCCPGARPEAQRLANRDREPWVIRKEHWDDAGYHRDEVARVLPENPPVNTFERAARMKKAVGLADVLWAALTMNAQGVPDKIHDAAWDIASRQARVNPPSEETKTMVMEMLRRREDLLKPQEPGCLDTHEQEIIA